MRRERERERDLARQRAATVAVQTAALVLQAVARGRLARREAARRRRAVVEAHTSVAAVACPGRAS